MRGVWTRVERIRGGCEPGYGKDERKIPLKTERAARQQGSSFLRENSSNGGKTIRTFWLHSRGGGRECQEQILDEIKYLISGTYKMLPRFEADGLFEVSSPFSDPEKSSFLGFS